MPASRVIGFVLAGGRSARMGRDKCELPWGSGDLLGSAVERLQTLTGDVRLLVGRRPRYEDRGLPVLLDEIGDIGPLGGILTALGQVAPDGLAVVLAVDLPLVSAELLGFLLSLAAGTDVVVPAWRGGVEPLAAVYRGTCLGAARNAVARGSFRITSFFADVRVREVAEGELARFGDPEAAFRNVNDPADYARARRQTGA